MANSGQSLHTLILRLAPMIYGPTMIFALGEGAIIPLIPTLAVRLGADLATAALVGSALVVGMLAGSLPASWLVAKTGERITMTVAGISALVSAFGLLLAPNVAVLGGSIFVLGVCTAAFGLARQSFMTTHVPFGFRARALSLLGGTFRFGSFVGPLVAAGLLSVTGSELSAIWLLIGCLVVTVLLVWFGPDPESKFAAVDRRSRLTDTGSIIVPPAREGIFRTMVTHRAVLSRLGSAAAALAAVRSARDVVLPIWGVAIGLEAHTILMIVGIAGALDFALFYVSGQVMDRFGRLWAVVPALSFMSLGFIGLSLTQGLASVETWFAVLTIVIGLGNGLSSGFLLTMGADLAPRDDPAAFLGSWRTLTTGGSAAAPLLFSAIAVVAPLPIAMACMGALGIAGIAGFLRWVPRYVKR